MAARKIDLTEKDWYKTEREPASGRDHLVIVQPEVMEILKDCPKSMSVKYVADFLGYSIDSLYRWIREYDKSKGLSGLRARIVGKGTRRIFKEDLAICLAMRNASHGR